MAVMPPKQRQIRMEQRIGLDPREIPGAALPNDTLGYVEFHIEQGPVLDALERPLGVVEAIARALRLDEERPCIPPS